MALSEENRIATLRSLGVLDPETEPFFETLVDHLTNVMTAEFAAITFVDSDQLWLKAKRGLRDAGLERQGSFCSYTIETNSVLSIPETHADPRFAEHPWVLGDPFIRAYIGAPITVLGQRIGTVCCMATSSRYWTKSNKANISHMASLVTEYLIERIPDDRKFDTKYKYPETPPSEYQQAAIEQVFEGFVVQDINGTVLDHNPAACKILRLDEDQLRGLTSLDPRWQALDPAGNNISGADHPAMVALRTGKPVTDFLMAVQTPDEDRVWLRINARPIGEKGSDNYRSVTTFSDVTPLRDAFLATEKERFAREHFLTSVSHELRNPMNAMLGLTQVVLGTDLKEDQRRHLESIESSGKTVVSLLNDLLDKSKAEAGHFDIRSAPTQLHAALEKQMALWRPIAEEKNLELLFQLKSEIPGTLVLDETRVTQCVSNLLSNAIKFTSLGTVTLSVSCRARGELLQEVHISVHDTGSGLSQEDIAKIYEPFQQVGEMDTSEMKGTGLGLYLVQALACKMGGRSWVESEVGTGSTFHMTFLAESTLQPAHTETPIEPETPVPSSDQLPIKVLVVDDQELNRVVCRLMLERYGATTVDAENGKVAEGILEREEFDVIVLDYQMPVMGGAELLKILKGPDSPAPTTPVIMLTADAVGFPAPKAEELGATGYLAKPYVEPDLIASIQRVLP